MLYIYFAAMCMILAPVCTLYFQHLLAAELWIIILKLHFSGYFDVSFSYYLQLYALSRPPYALVVLTDFRFLQWQLCHKTMKRIRKKEAKRQRNFQLWMVRATCFRLFWVFHVHVAKFLFLWKNVWSANFHVLAKRYFERNVCFSQRRGGVGEKFYWYANSLEQYPVKLF